MKEDRKVIDSLYRISSLVSSTENPQDALKAILEEIVRILGATSASIALINPYTERLEVEVSFGLPDEYSNIELRLGEGVTGWVALHQKPLLVPDVSADTRYIEVKPGVRSEMAVPMEDRGNTLGVVNVDSDSVNAFSEQDLRTMSLLATEATRVVSKLWLIDQLRTYKDRLQALVNTGQNLVSKRDPGAVLDGITEEARSILDCRICALFLFDHQSKTLELHSLSGISDDLKDYKERLSLEDSAVGSAILRRKQVEVSDLRRTEEHHFTTIIGREGLVSLLSSPLHFENEVIGVLNAYTDNPHRFSDDEKEIFGTLASLGSVAIVNARLYSRVFSSEETLRHNERLTTLGLLAAEIAHEIRNPLTVIRLLFESLDLHFSTEDMRHRDAAIIGEKLDQLEGIVTRVLSFGKSGSGLHARWNFSAVIRDTLHLVRLKLEQSRVSATYKPKDEALTIEGSKAQIQQVLLNLIINAMQAMPAGGSVNVASYRDTNENGPIAVVEIADTGHGISEEKRDQIFDSFLSGKHRGVGLGLTIVKRIVESHRGRIELAQTSESGTTMRFWLPVVPEHRQL